MDSVVIPCRGFRLGFNSLCAYSSVNHLHFHTWYSEYPSYLEAVVSFREISHVVNDHIFPMKHSSGKQINTISVNSLQNWVVLRCLKRNRQRPTLDCSLEEVTDVWQAICHPAIQTSVNLTFLMWERLVWCRRQTVHNTHTTIGNYHRYK